MVEMLELHRLGRMAVLLCVGAAIVGSLSWAAGSPVTLVRNLATGRQEFDGLVSAAAGVAAWIGLGWFGSTLALEAAAALPGCCGRACAWVAARVCPPTVRRIAQALVGVTVLAGPLVAGSAQALERPQTTTSLVRVVDQPTAPAEALTAAPSVVAPLTVVPSVVTPSPASSPSASSSSPSPPPSGSLFFDLDRPDAARPGTAFVPLPPRSATRETPAGPAALAAGTVHRDNRVDSYVVHRGDALWDIAARHLGPHATAADIAREWPRWYTANRDVIGPDPAVIRPGQLLRPPA
jgi:resuscitation-promoting factor RpfA